jgi:signal transduction histidine kinase
LLSGDLHAHELALTHSDGSIRWLAWTSTRLEAHARNSTIMFGIDVTQQKLAEHNAHELQVARTARHNAEAANLSKAQFLAVMSHELRTPLNAISGYAELIELGLRGPVTEAQINDLQKIRRSKEHLLGLINDILSFARIEAGSIQLDIKEVLAAEVIHTVHSMVEPSTKEKQIVFEVPLKMGHVVAFADRERTQQILTNLVCNAVKFTPARGKVELRCEQLGDRIQFEVHDTGVGIPAEKLESVFEPFVQLQQEPKSRNDGMGLGLYISRSLAAAMGGALTVESRVGEGSVFRLTLPAADRLHELHRGRAVHAGGAFGH